MTTFEMSHFTATIMDIAMEQGDYISQETLEELEEMVRPDVFPKNYGLTVAPGNENAEEHVKTTKEVIDCVKKMVEVGSFVSEKMGKFLGPIGTVAGFVKDIIEHFEEKQEDPVLKEIKELSKQLSALSEKMTAHFDDLKSFVVEQNFYDKYTVAISTLYKFMVDTLNDLSKESVKKFEANYKKSDPQTLVYEILTKLEQESTNPLKWAMKGDHLKSRTTFNKWKDILDSVLTEALFLEIYASALLPEVGNYGVQKILEKIAAYNEMHKKWNEEYLTKPYFWPAGVEKLVNDVHDNKSLTTKEQKIDKVWEGIEKIHTNFKFYVVVFESRHIWKYVKLWESQAIVSDRNGYAIVVYRSAEKPKRQLWQLKQYVERQNKTANMISGFQFDHWKIVRNYFELDFFKNHARRLETFYLIIAQDKGNIAVKASKMDGEKVGPGFFSYDGKLKCEDGFTTSTATLFYLLGD